MSVFDLDSRGSRDIAEQARLNPLDISQVDPGFWDGAVKGTAMGVMRGGAQAAKAVDILAAAPVALYESLTDQPGRYTDDWFRQVDETDGNAADFWTPRANEVGTAGRILGGFGEMALPLMVTGGNPSVLIGTQTAAPAADLVNQGVDAKTATAVGLVQGAATAAGFRLPYLGKTFATRMTSGVVGNLLTNAGATAAQHEALQLGGYEDLADQYDPLDFEARAIDVLTGIAFGGLAHLQMRPSDRVAVAAAANAKHFQADTAPGRPVDQAAHTAHQQAVEQAVQAVLRGEPVVPPPEVAAAAFDPVAREPIEVPAELQALDAARVETSAPEPVFPEPEAAAPVTGDVAPDAKAPPAKAQSKEDVQHEQAVAPARQAAMASKIRVPTGEIDADGNAATASAAEVLARSDLEIQQAKKDALGFEAAVHCFLSTGG